jgi:hypothetical protein
MTVGGATVASRARAAGKMARRTAEVSPASGLPAAHMAPSRGMTAPATARVTATAAAAVRLRHRRRRAQQ